MKTANGLFDQIPQRESLLLAVCKALRGKRRKGDARAFTRNLDGNLNELAGQIRTGDLRVGVCTQFTIHDPKERLITAPCFPERVLHHGIMNVCEPEFERRLIHHTYACRKGKGQFAALVAARRFAAGHEWFLKMDVRKYFESIPKALLLERLARVFREKAVLRLYEHILCAHRPGEPRGLPIGSLISQHCANLYLDAVDRLVTKRLRGGACVRYMDDFVIWAADKATLTEARDAVRACLAGLGLEFKGEPYLNRTAHGMDFLGHRVFHQRMTLNRRSRSRFVVKLREVTGVLAAGSLGEAEGQARLTALTAFVRHFGDVAWRRHAMERAGCAPLAPTA